MPTTTILFRSPTDTTRIKHTTKADCYWARLSAKRAAYALASHSVRKGHAAKRAERKRARTARRITRQHR
jgi:hypothetical protein